MRNCYQILNSVEIAVKSYKELLSEFISFKTISSSKSSKDDILLCINWLQSLLIENGFTTSVHNLKESNPIIFAENIISKEAKTILIYGHYDVQPAVESEGWKKAPFTLYEEDNIQYARGVADNKGQILMHLYTVLSLLKSKELKYNIKFLIEGNEETGSKELPDFIRNNKDLLKADFVLISDGELSNNAPTLEIGFRGNANFTLEIKSAKSSVHSGMFGNSIPNSIVEISKLLSSFYDENYSIKIDGMNSGLENIDKNYLKMIKADNKSFNEIQENFGFKKVFVKDDYDFQFQNGLMPSLIITGIEGGHHEEGYANIVPNHAKIKVNVRFSPLQDSKNILEKIEKHIKEKINPYIDYKIEFSSITEGTLIDIDNEYFKRVTNILESVYKNKSVYKFVGGSLPIINSFVSELNVPLLSIPLANSNCNMHGVNENYTNDSIQLARQFCIKLYTE